MLPPSTPARVWGARPVSVGVSVCLSGRSRVFLPVVGSPERAPSAAVWDQRLMPGEVQGRVSPPSQLTASLTPDVPEQQGARKSAWKTRFPSPTSVRMFPQREGWKTQPHSWRTPCLSLNPHTRSWPCAQ